MAITDTILSSGNNDKLYVTSGTFTTTVKTSINVSAINNIPTDIDWDETNTPWSGQQFGRKKLYLQSGQFTSTVKTSGSGGDDATGISSTGTLDTPWCGDAGNILYLQSGQFTATTKISLGIGAVDSGPSGISWDGINSPWCGTSAQKLYLQSGQFTSTLKTSEDLSGLAATVKSVSYNGTDTHWCGSASNKMYLQSGQFTSTVKTSQETSSAMGINNPDGIATMFVSGGRLPSPDNTGSSALNLPMLFGVTNNIIELPLFWMNNPQAIELPILGVSGGVLAVTSDGAFTFPSLTMVGRSGATGIMTLPLFTLGAGVNFSMLTLPMFTIHAEQKGIGSGVVNLPIFATNTVAQQGFVHSVFTTLPALSLTAYTGHDIDLTLPIFTMDNSGSNAGLASFDQSLPRMVIVVKGKQLETGVSRLFLPEFNLSGNLLTGIISVSGGNRTLPMFTTDLHAYRGENGDGAMSMPMFTTATQAVDNPQGALVQNLKMFTLDAFADQFINRII
jgi:hypothetical protein